MKTHVLPILFLSAFVAGYVYIAATIITEARYVRVYDRLTEVLHAD